MKLLSLYAVPLLLILSCEGPTANINYQQQIDTTAVLDDRMNDTTKMLVAQLPLKFDSTRVLIFPVKLVDLEEKGRKVKTEYGSSYEMEYSSSSHNGSDYVSGSFINLIFRTADGTAHKLTDHKLLIRQVTFLREVFEQNRGEYLLYRISDRDTNGNKELDHADLEALYISRIDGSGFKKLNRELHEFYDFTYIKDEHKIYFRTLEDRNKDGRLNNKDLFHHYQLQFNEGGYALSEHNPLAVFE